MRVLAVDLGLRRIGLAISDATGTLARPFRVLVTGGRDPAVMVAGVIAELDGDGETVEAVVVGLPRRLDGSDHEMTVHASAFASALGVRTGLPVVLQDERLSSHEAEALLSERYPDWRDRKARLDAAAAAVILQDYLDGRPRRPLAGADSTE